MNRFQKVTIYLLLLQSVTITGQEFEHSKVVTVPDMGFLPGVFSGLDILQEMKFEQLRDKRLAILTNQSALNRDGRHFLDLLAEQKDKFDVQIIFTPQYGILTDPVHSLKPPPDGMDERFDAQIKRLWGREYRPNVLDLREVDLVIIDLQDTGVRFHTFMTTVTKVMEAAAEYEKPVILLDRPNPLNGNILDGPVVRPQFQSFVGYHLVPIRHGLTVGEYALMVNETGWIRQSVICDLTVIPMSNWRRDMWIDETGLTVTPLWKGIVDPVTLTAAAGMGLLEGTNLSFGEGTSKPYTVVGAPWLVPHQLLMGLNKAGLPGVRFAETTFTPDSLSDNVSHPLYAGQECYGVKLIIENKDRFDPLRTTVTILSLTANLEPRRFKWVGNNYVDKLYGHNYLRLFIAQERDIRKLPATWSEEVIRFNQFRQKFLLY